MGLDLTLCPVKWKELKCSWLLYDRIGLDRNYDLFEAIKERIKPLLVPQYALPVLWYDDEGLQDRNTDPYDEPLTYILPKDFDGLESEYARNQAIIEFMRSLPPDMPIVLWWN